MKTPLVFICGSLRSGSSLTHLMIDHHSEISNPGEFDFLFDQILGNGANKAAEIANPILEKTYDIMGLIRSR